MKCEYCNGTGRKQDDRLIGLWARKNREASSIGLRQMADLIGLSHSYLCQLELGRRRWRRSLSERFRRGLSVSENESRKTSKPSKQREK